MIDEIPVMCADSYGTKAKVSLVHRGDKVMESAEVYNRNSGARKLSGYGVNARMRTSIVRVDADAITFKVIQKSKSACSGGTTHDDSNQITS